MRRASFIPASQPLAAAETGGSILSRSLSLLPLLIVLLLSAITTPASADALRPYYHSPEYDSGDYGAWPRQLYRSSAVSGPLLNYVEDSERCKEDGVYTFIAPRGYAVRGLAGPMIIDQQGSLIWSKPYGQTYNVNVYNYKGQRYITFWSGDDSKGHGSGAYYMVSLT